MPLRGRGQRPTACGGWEILWRYSYRTRKPYSRCNFLRQPSPAKPTSRSVQHGYPAEIWGNGMERGHPELKCWKGVGRLALSTADAVASLAAAAYSAKGATEQQQKQKHTKTGPSTRPGSQFPHDEASVALL